MLYPTPKTSRKFGAKTFLFVRFATARKCEGIKVVVYGKAPMAVELAQELMAWTEDILICSPHLSGLPEKQRRWLAATNVGVREEPIERLLVEHGSSQAVQLKSLETVRCRALFLTVPGR